MASTTYDRGVESGTGKSGSSDQRLCDLELVGVSLLVFDGTVAVGGAVVEALESLGGDNGCSSREGNERCGRTHMGDERCSMHYCLIDMEVMWMCSSVGYTTSITVLS